MLYWTAIYWELTASYKSYWTILMGLFHEWSVNIMTLNTLRPRQICCHFADGIFKCILFNENVWISINISLKFLPKGPINNIPALFQIMTWRRPGDKPLSEPMMATLLTHICVTRPQWVNVSCVPCCLTVLVHGWMPQTHWFSQLDCSV